MLKALIHDSFLHMNLYSLSDDWPWNFIIVHTLHSDVQKVSGKNIAKQLEQLAWFIIYLMSIGTPLL